MVIGAQLVLEEWEGYAHPHPCVVRCLQSAKEVLGIIRTAFCGLGTTKVVEDALQRERLAEADGSTNKRLNYHRGCSGPAADRAVTTAAVIRAPYGRQPQRTIRAAWPQRVVRAVFALTGA